MAGRGWAGWGGLVFGASVVAQNVIQATAAPSEDADPREVIDHFVAHRGALLALAPLFVIGAFGLALFVGGWWEATRSGGGMRATGLLGVSGVFAIFPVLVATEFALLVATDRRRPDLGVVDTLFVLHNAVFQVLVTAIAVALVGVALSGVRAGFVPNLFRWLAPVGALLLVVGTVFGPRLAAGELQPVMGVGVLGFLVWLAVVVTTSIRLLQPLEDARPGLTTG